MSRILAPDSSPLRRIQSSSSAPKFKDDEMQNADQGNSSSNKKALHSGLEFTKTNFIENTAKKAGSLNGHTSTSSSSSNRLGAMAKSINERSQNSLPAANAQSKGHAQRRRQDSLSDKESDSARPSKKKFKSAIEHFTYNGPGSSQRDAIDVGDSEELSSLSELSGAEDGTSSRSVEPEKRKKRKFVRASARDDPAENGKSAIEVHDSSPIAERQTEPYGARTVSPFAARPLKRVTTIPDSPSSPVSVNNANRPAPSVTRSFIKTSIPKSGVQVKTKIMPRIASPNLPKQTASQSSSKAVDRIKSSARSTPTTEADDYDDDEDDESGSGADSDDGYDADRSNERKALQWFNINDEKQMMDIVGLTADQASIIVSLRPFHSTEDLTSKLSETKGVNPRLFHNCTDLLSGLQRIDTVLEKCGKMGHKLDTVLTRWKNDPSHIGRGDPEYLFKQPEGASDGVELRDFQLYGVNWLNLLYRTQCSGILADDMGLGKTAQVISFLNQIVLRRERKPHLIVVPSSVLTNWMREFDVFGPRLRVFKYHGSQKERNEQQHELRSDRKAYDVVITTYDMAAGGERDHKFLRKYDFDAIIYDEGHVLKNQKSVKYGKLIRLQAGWRLLLTGTPLQNNLGELMSLLKFIMPTYFRGAEEALSQIFSVSQETQLSRDRIQRAKQMMQPFVLRRKKADVLDSLKPKTERVKYCDMTDDQRKLYRQSFARSRAALLEQKENDEKEASAQTRSRSKSNKSQTLKSGHVLMELRKAANHPLLFRRLYDDSKIDALARDYLKVAEHATDDLQEKKEDFAINSDAELCMSIAMQYRECAKHVLPSKAWLNSGKIAALKEVIDEAQARGERLIVFSQFVQTLEIVCRALEVMNVTYRGFTGSTDVNARQELVDEFTRDDSITCFLLSTRAGGVGINLTAANWVVLFDQDFNPQNDRQAADRCYRMGQEKEVTIVRLISRGTIDEHIFNLGKTKLKLAERVQAEHGGSAAVNDIDEDEAERQAEDQEAVEKKMEKSLLAGIMAADEDDDQQYDASDA